MSDRGYRRLAAAVVIEAFQDAAGVRLRVTGNHSRRNRKEKDSREARKFIESDQLDFWCSVVDLDPDAIRDRLLTATHEHRLAVDGHRKKGSKDMENINQDLKQTEGGVWYTSRREPDGKRVVLLLGTKDRQEAERRLEQATAEVSG